MNQPKAKSICFLTQYDALGASSRIVVYDFLDTYRRAGFEVKVLPLIEGEDVYRILGDLAKAKTIGNMLRVLAVITVRFGKRYRHVMAAWRADVAFVQKDVLPFGLRWLLRFRQPNIIFEFDDPIWLPHPGSGGGVPVLGKLFAAYRKRLLIKMLKVAKLVIVDNESMRQFSLPYCSRTVVVNSPIDLTSYKIQPADQEELSFGWIGSPSTTYLLETTLTLLEPLASEFKFCVYNLGSAPLKSAFFPVHNIAWSQENELLYLPKFSVGLMPTDNQLFNQFRLSRKWLSYATAEVPTLATDSYLNRSILKQGVTGVLYNGDSAEDFTNQARILLSDAKLRRVIGRNAREEARLHYDKPIVGERYVALAERLLREEV